LLLLALFQNVLENFIIQISISASRTPILFALFNDSLHVSIFSMVNVDVSNVRIWLVYNWWLGDVAYDCLVASHSWELWVEFYAWEGILIPSNHLLSVALHGCSVSCLIIFLNILGGTFWLVELIMQFLCLFYVCFLLNHLGNEFLCFLVHFLLICRLFWLLIQS